MITLDGVSKSYPTAQGGRRIVLDNVSAAFPDGSNVGILGGNGAGKSTLIRLLAGSEMPDRGRIRRSSRVSFPLGYGGTFHGSLSGRENVSFIARIYGANLRETIDYVIEFTELDIYFDMPVNTYSAVFTKISPARLIAIGARSLFSRAPTIRHVPSRNKPCHCALCRFS